MVLWIRGHTTEEGKYENRNNRSWTHRGTLARKLASIGHQVRIANSRAPSSLTEIEGEEGITPVWADEAAEGADIVILSLPQKAIGTLSKDLKSTLLSVPIVIDTGNYYPVRDGNIDSLDQGTADSEWVAGILGRPIFKAFNNIGAPSLKYKGTDDEGQRLGLTVAGPSGEDKQKVSELIDQLGFDPVDGGDLGQSWRLQPGTPIYCKDMTADEMRAGLEQTTREDIGSYHEERDQIVDFDAAMKRVSESM